MTKLLNKTLMTALSVLFFVAINPAQASENPFGTSKMTAETMQVAEMAPNGKCGEGKCGGAMKKAAEKEAKCGEGKSEKSEGKCGEGKSEKSEGKCGQGKSEKKEGKCGQM